MIEIQIQNSKSKIIGNRKEILSLREILLIRHPKAFFVKQKMKNSFGWDGKIRYISEAGYISTGYLPWLLRVATEKGIEYTLDDRRELIEPEELVMEISDQELRTYQQEAINSILYNKLDGIPFYRGIINAATNAGKTLMMIGMFKSFPKQKGIILLNEATLYTQFMNDMPRYFSEGDWGYMRGKEIRWGNIMVVMVQTLIRHIPEYQHRLSKIDIVFIDECDLSTSDTYKTILKHLYNASVRVGLSGTVFLSKLKKDDMKNNEVKEYLGEELFKIKNMELINMGYSTPVVVKIVMGNRKFAMSSDYPEVYKANITQNQERTDTAVQRVKFNLERGRKPLVVVCQYIEHVELMYKAMKGAFGLKHSIAYAHHETKDRDQIFADFRDGKLDILVVSHIVKRGKNLPLIRYILNAGGGDSSANVLQIVGRGVRTHESKRKVILEDFMDAGDYLESHSKHRLLTYKNEGFKMIFIPPLLPMHKKKKK